MTKYAPLMPARWEDTPVVYSYEHMRTRAARVRYLSGVRVSTDSALALAELSPYPRGVKLGIMKYYANTRYVTLSQLRIILGWSADRAQR